MRASQVRRAESQWRRETGAAGQGQEKREREGGLVKIILFKPFVSISSPIVLFDLSVLYLHK